MSSSTSGVNWDSYYSTRPPDSTSRSSAKKIFKLSDADLDTLTPVGTNVTPWRKKSLHYSNIELSALSKKKKKEKEDLKRKKAEERAARDNKRRRKNIDQPQAHETGIEETEERAAFRRFIGQYRYSQPASSSAAHCHAVAEDVNDPSTARRSANEVIDLTVDRELQFLGYFDLTEDDVGDQSE